MEERRGGLGRFLDPYLPALCHGNTFSSGRPDQRHGRRIVRCGLRTGSVPCGRSQVGRRARAVSSPALSTQSRESRSRAALEVFLSNFA